MLSIVSFHADLTKILCLVTGDAVTAVVATVIHQLWQS